MLTTRTQLAHATKNEQVATMELLISHSKTSRADIQHSSVKAELLDFKNWGLGIEERLSVLLEAGVDVNMTDSDNTSIIMLAMLASEAAVRKVLEYGPDLSARNKDGDTVLTMINEETSVGSVKRVLRLGAQLDVVDNDSWSPLMWAVSVPNLDVLEYLMTIDTVRSNLNLLGKEGTALHIASYRGHVKAVKALLEHGAEIDLPGEGYVGTPIMEAIMGDKEAVVQLLLQSVAQLDQPVGLLCLPIFAACLVGSRSLIRLLMEQHRVSIDVVDLLKRRPVHLACYNKSEILEQLEPPEGDFDARDCVGRVPLHYACLSGDVALMEHVFERSKSVGVGIDIQDYDGWTPLLWAARASDIYDKSCPESRHSEVVSWLISKGADVTVHVDGMDANYEPVRGSWTAIEIAVYHGAETIVDLLRTHVRSDMTTTAQEPRRIGLCARKFCECCLIVRLQIPLATLP